MRIEELEAKLAAWDQTVANVTSNVIELTELETYRVLSNGAERHLEGPDADGIRKALAQVETLLLDLGLVRSVVERARKARDELSWISGASSVAAVARILDGPSIDRPREAVPLEQRGLLIPAESIVKHTPAALVELMAKAFAEAKSVLLPIDKIRRTLGVEIAGLAGDAHALVAAFEQAALPPPPAVVSFEREVSKLEAMLRREPLRLDAPAVAFVRSYARAASKARAELEAHRERLEAEVRTARERATKVLGLESSAKALAAELGEPYAGIASAEQFGLLEALDAAERAARGRAWRDVPVRLEAFQRQYTAIIGPLRALHGEFEKRAEAERQVASRWEKLRRRRDANANARVRDDRVLPKFARRIDELFRDRNAREELEQLLLSFEVRLGQLEAPKRK